MANLAPESSISILGILEQAMVTVFAQDAELRYRWIENPPAAWNASPIVGKSDFEVLPPNAAAIATAVKREVLASGYPQWTDLVVDTATSTCFFDMFVAPERDHTGAVVGVVGLALEVTDRRKRGAALEAVARDISHRSKNLLAVIQSLAAQTARTASSTDDFIDQFRGRIQSISRSQDLAIGTKRQGAALADLISVQVEPYVIDAERRIELRGANYHLSPNAALHVGLALYELCIRSVQLGSLSAPDGRVLVTAELTGSPTDKDGMLRVTWSESHGPHAPETDGFAKTLLERIVPASVGGNATLTTTVDGRRYDLTISAAEFDARG